LRRKEGKTKEGKKEEGREEGRKVAIPATDPDKHRRVDVYVSRGIRGIDSVFSLSVAAWSS
jgi:hypothetical protein